MNNETLDALLVWGDRSNRDTAHLLDIAIAGTIEQTIGHGTVVLRPARLEEIVSRIAPRERDPDGGWKVTLLPESVGNYDAGPNTERTSAAVASVAGKALNLTLDDLTDGTVSAEECLTMLHQLAGSALTQRG